MLLTDQVSITADVDLQKIGESGVSTVDTPLPPIFYVIVGAGPAAVINHSTLVHSAFGKKRLEGSPAGKLPILHIGFSNPWGRYMQHGMGQPPHLLSLPGFKSANMVTSAGRVVDGGLDSRVFSGCIDHQFESLREREIARWRDEPTAPLTKRQWPWNDGWVAMVQTRAKEPFTGKLEGEIGGPEVKSEIDAIVKAEYPIFPDRKIAPYRVMVIRKVDKAWKAEWIYAQFIDFCSGTGRPRALITPDKSDESRKAKTPPWLNPASWIAELGNRRILSGADAICEIVRWTANERICVPKGGGIGLNAAEKAVHNKCQLDWFDDKPLVPTFVNPRNYTFLKHWSEDRARMPEEKQSYDAELEEPDLVPAYPKGRIGRYAEMTEAKLVSGGTKVEVTLTFKGRAARIRNASREESGLSNGCWEQTGDVGNPPSKIYDWLALPQGLDVAGVGQPKWLVERFELTSEICEPADRRMVALGTADQTIRLLGAAAQLYPGFTANEYRPDDDPMSPMTGMWSYRATLPVSTVPDGFILSGVNIASANQFFTKERPNPNLNTLPTADIEDILFKTGMIDSSELADIIAADRNESNGYKDGGDLVQKLKFHAEQRAAAAAKMGKDAFVKQRVEAVKKQLTDDKAAALKRYKEEREKVKQTDLLANTLIEQYKQLEASTAKEYDEKLKERTEIAATKARIEFMDIDRRAKRILELVDKHAEVLRSAFRYAYDPIDD